MLETTYRSFESRPFRTQLTQILLTTEKNPSLDQSLDGQESIVGTLRNTQILPAHKEEDWTKAKVQINNSSLQSLRKISLQRELNS